MTQPQLLYSYARDTFLYAQVPPANATMSALFRANRRNRRRHLRKDALPISSALFVAVTAVLGVGYRVTSRVSEPVTALPGGELLSLAAVRNSAAGYGDLCNGDGFLDSNLALILLFPGIVLMFVGLAVVTDDYFVASLERICERLKLSEDVAGATFMAAGSSAPELFTSLLAVFVTNDDVGIGTIVGSAVFNILVIIGLSAALAGSVMKLDWRPLVRDSSFYILSIILLLLFVLGPSKGNITWWEGLLLMLTYASYILFMKFGNQPYMKWAGSLGSPKSTELPEKDVEAGLESTESSSSPGTSTSPDKGPYGSLGLEVSHDAQAGQKGDYENGRKPEYKDLNPRAKLRALQYAVIAANRLASAAGKNSAVGSRAEGNANGDIAADADEEPLGRRFLGVELPNSLGGKILFPFAFPWRLAFQLTIVDCSKDSKAHLWWVTFLLAIAWIGAISYVMVEAARLAGCLIGIPASVMGLTVLAAGTSVPDALASVAVARNGQGNMAVSNAIGSNVFDILLGLGLPWFLGGLINKRPQAVTVDPVGAVVIPICILFVIIVLLLAILVAMRWKLRPLLGYVLFVIYGVFLLYEILDVYVFKLGT